MYVQTTTRRGNMAEKTEKFSEVDIFKQIEELKKKLNDNRPNALEEVLTKIEFYDFTAKELGFKSARGKKEGGSVSAKYKGPKGETWSGRGLAPKWMQGDDEKTAEQKKIDYLIKEE